MKRTERAAQIQRATQEYGVLNYVLAYLDWDCGLDVRDVLEDLLQDLQTSTSDWPTLAPLAQGPIDLGGLRETHRAEASWDTFHGDFATWARQRYGLPDTPAWRSLLTVQTALMPSSGRSFPESVEVPHDVVAWFISRCRFGHECCSLDSQPAGCLVVRDPWGLSSPWSADRARTRSSRWELDSPLMEARAHYQQDASEYSQSA